MMLISWSYKWMLYVVYMMTTTNYWPNSIQLWIDGNFLWNRTCSLLQINHWHNIECRPCVSCMNVFFKSLHYQFCHISNIWTWIFPPRILCSQGFYVQKDFMFPMFTIYTWFLNKFVIKINCLNLFIISSSQVVMNVSTWIDIKPMIN